MSKESPALAPDEIRRRVADYEWYHRLDLGHGITTPGAYDLRGIIQNYGLPDDLRGKEVLDVGPGHGFFAFEFERRGATVSTSELPHWAEHDVSPQLHEQFQAYTRDGDIPEAYHRGAFGFAIEARQSRVKRHFCNVYDLTPERLGTYDLVFCASVLLHLTDPLRALYGIRKVCRDQAIVCTGIDTSLHVAGQSRAHFVGQANGQAFWLPTIACLEQMVVAAGFARVERVSTFNLKSVDGKYATPHGTVRAFVS
jgi:tRNA (mo5U34)-methyltransferase